MFDPKEMAAEVVKQVREFVAKATEPLIAKVADLERSAAANTDANMRNLAAVYDHIAALPKPKDGEVDYTKVWAGCVDLIRQQLESLPKVRDGKDADPELMRSMAMEEAEKAVANLPPPKDGKDAEVDYEKIITFVRSECVGMRGALTELIEGMVPDEVAKAADGLPTPMHPDTVRMLIRDDAQRIVDAIPRPKDGAPGFSLEDFTVELSGDRTLVFKFARDGVEKVCEVSVPWPIDAGAFRVDEVVEYARGDGVSYKGCWWIAKSDTKDVPGTSPAWRMAVKAGRDGKDLRPDEMKRVETVRLR